MSGGNERNTNDDQREFAIMRSRVSEKWKSNSVYLESRGISENIFHTFQVREKLKILRLFNARDYRRFPSISSPHLFPSSNNTCWDLKRKQD